MLFKYDSYGCVWAHVCSALYKHNWGSLNSCPCFCVFSISFRHLQPQTVSQTHRQQHLPCTHDSIQQNTIFPTINPVVIVIVVAWAHLIHPLCESTRNPRHPSLSAAFIVSCVRQKRIFLALERRLIAGVSQRWMYEETNSSNLDEDSTISPTGAQSILCTHHMTLLTYRAAHAAFSASLTNACIRMHLAFHKELPNTRALLFQMLPMHLPKATSFKKKWMHAIGDIRASSLITICSV